MTAIMTDAPPPPTSSPVQPTAPTAPSFTPTLALVIAIMAVAGCVWLAVDSARSQAKLKQQMVDYLARGDRTNTESRQIADRADNVARALDDRVDQVEQRLADWQNQQAAMEALYRNLARTRDEWVLSEIEQMLLNADQQLQLANNINGALAALQAAEQVLQRQPQTALINLRRALAKDIDALRSRPQRDVVGTIARLDTLIGEVDEWPLQHQFRLPAPASPAAERSALGSLASLWDDLRSLIRVQYTGDRDLALLSPEGGTLLRENLRLRLTAARFASLRGDESQLNRELGLSREWLERYFNVRNEATRAALTQITQLSRGSVRDAPPQIAGSLEALRQARRAFDSKG